jgi:hypothetical protein
MKKFYQILNYQFQIAQTFDNLDAAKAYIAMLNENETYKLEKFYIVELQVVYSS